MKKNVLTIVIVFIMVIMGCCPLLPEQPIVVGCDKPCLVSLSNTKTINANLIKQIGMSCRIDNDGPKREVQIDFINKTIIWIPASDPKKEIERITSLVKSTCN